MDLRLAGADALIAIRAEFPEARIIMLTTSDTDGDIQRALRAGAFGYILKSVARSQLLGALRSVHAGRSLTSPSRDQSLHGRTGEVSRRRSGGVPMGALGRECALGVVFDLNEGGRT